MTQTLVRRIAVLAGSFGAALSGASAGAQSVEPAPASVEAMRPRTGVELAIHTGAGGHLNDSSTAFTAAPRAPDHLFWPGFGVQVWSGYRFLPWLSLGGHFGFQNNPARELPRGTTAGVANSVTAGAYLKVYIGSAFNWRRLDPWVSISVNPFSTLWADHETPNGNVRARFAAISVPVSVGLDYNFTDRISAGLLIQASPWIPFEACRTTGPGAQTSGCTTANLGTNTYLFAGAGMRITLPQL